MNRTADADDARLRPQIRLLSIGAVISVVFLAGSLGIVLGGLNDPTIQLPRISPAQTTPPNLPSGYPTGLSTNLPANLPTDLPTNFPANLPTDIPTNLIPTALPSIPGGNQ